MKEIKLIQSALLLTALFVILSCGEKSIEKTTEFNVPGHELLSVDPPLDRSDKLEYTIKIPTAIESDSLQIIQDYFIEKGRTDYPDASKIIVRVYVEGESMKSTPYAMLNLIAGEKNIIINGSTLSAAFINSKLQGYTIKGCWIVYGDNDYVICEKEGKYYGTFVNKKKQEVSRLEVLVKKTKNGEAAYYEKGDITEYMVIKSDGLYIYNVNYKNPEVWANDDTWILE